MKKYIILCASFIVFLSTPVFAHNIGIPHVEDQTAAVIAPSVIQPGGSSELLKQVDQVKLYNSLLLRYAKNAAVDTQTESYLIDIAKKRKDIMKVLIRKSPVNFINSSLSTSNRNTMPSGVQAYIEKREILRGNLVTLHIDDFEDTENSKFIYNLNVGSKEYEVLSVSKLADRRGGPSSVSGITLDNIIMLETGDNGIIQSATQGTEAIGEQRMLVLLVDMLNNESTVTIEQANEKIFGQSSLFQKFYKDQSYGKAWFTGKVYKISLNRSVGSGCGSDVSISDHDVLSEIQKQEIDLSKYDRVLFMPPVGYCSEVGKSDLVLNGKLYKLSQSWVGFNSLNYGSVSKTLLHEIGHALGVTHANLLLCDTACKHIEYGNVFDIMGFGIGSFNALYKEQLGWLTDNDFLKITSNGDYSIGFLESKSGIRAAKVINPAVGSDSISYLERRSKENRYFESEALDEGGNLLLNIPRDTSRIKTSDPWLIDMNPSGDYSLGLGKKFDFKSRGITIGPVQLVDEEKKTTKFSINFSKPSCDSIPPVIVSDSTDDSIKGIPVAQGGILYMYFNVMNATLCKSETTFTLDFLDLPAGWTVVDSSPKNVKVTANSYYSFYASIKVPEDDPSRSFSFRASIKDISNNTSSVEYIGVRVIERPSILSVNLDRPETAEDKPNYFVAGDPIIIKTNLKPSDVTMGSVNATIETLDGSFVGGPKDNASEYSDGNISMRLPSNLKTGKYNIVVQAQGAISKPYLINVRTNSNFIEPTIKINAANLKVVYDNNAEVLQYGLAFQINSGSEDLFLSKDYSLELFLMNSAKSLYGSFESVLMTTKDDVVTKKDQYGYDNYFIPKNSEVSFNVTAKVKTQQMFAGAYATFVKSIYLKKDLSSDSYPLNVGKFVGNFQNIIGEISPYIIDSGIKTLNNGEIWNIQGNKLSGSLIWIDGKDYPTIPISVSNDGKKASIGPMPETLLSGDHTLVLKNPNTGDSNIIRFVYSNSSRPSIPGQSITTNTSKIKSGNALLLNLSYPTNTTKAIVVVSCPKSVTIDSPNQCGTTIDVTSKKTYQLVLRNKDFNSNLVTINYYVYLDNKQEYANGMAIGVSVEPIINTFKSTPTPKPAKPVETTYVEKNTIAEGVRGYVEFTSAAINSYGGIWKTILLGILH